MVSVTIVAKDKNFREHDFGRCAVHGILFRGYSDAKAAFTSSSHAAMMGSPMAEMQHERQSLADTLRRYVKNVHLPED